MDNLILFLQLISVLLLFFAVVYVGLVVVAFGMLRVMRKLEEDDEKETNE